MSDRGVGCVGPGSGLLEGADALALVRSEERELDAVLRQQLERAGVRGGFGEPHALGRRAVVVLVVGNAPADLGDAVALAGQGQNDVVVDLRHGGAVTAEDLAAAPFAVEDHAIGALRVLLEPTEQRRPEVEADARVVVHDANDLVGVVDDTRRAIGGVALRADALVQS